LFFRKFYVERSPKIEKRLRSHVWLFSLLNASLAQKSREGAIKFPLKKELGKKKLHFNLIN
jgi:hypothetical protein